MYNIYFIIEWNPSLIRWNSRGYHTLYIIKLRKIQETF